jgi:hypothetical protein
MGNVTLRVSASYEWLDTPSEERFQRGSKPHPRLVLSAHTARTAITKSLILAVLT